VKNPISKKHRKRRELAAETSKKTEVKKVNYSWNNTSHT
jgi:hypothetical protein